RRRCSGRCAGTRSPPCCSTSEGATVKAVVFERPGGPEVLELREVPDPKPGPADVLVAVKACGINHLDLWVRAGLRGLEIEMPHILGNDVAGGGGACGHAGRHCV